MYSGFHRLPERVLSPRSLIGGVTLLSLLRQAARCVVSNENRVLQEKHPDNERPSSHVGLYRVPVYPLVSGRDDVFEKWLFRRPEG